MSIFLIGYRGSGKSTIGRRLADRLWQSFVDLDEMIVREAGKSIKEIFEQDGEEGFRDIESRSLAEAVKLEEQVIALGGGAVIRPENRSAIRTAGGKVIYLRCEPEVLLARIQGDASSAAYRPALTPLGGGIDEVRLKVAEREAIYREVMTGEVDVTSLTPDEAVVRIVRML